MKKKLISKLHQIIIEIAKSDDEELNKIGIELIEIEKKLMKYQKKDISSLIDKL